MKHKKSISKNFADCDYLASAATQDCTGLIPTPATNKTEQESYEELYPFLPKIPTHVNDEDTIK